MLFIENADKIYMKAYRLSKSAAIYADKREKMGFIIGLASVYCLSNDHN